MDDVPEPCLGSEVASTPSAGTLQQAPEGLLGISQLDHVSVGGRLVGATRPDLDDPAYLDSRTELRLAPVPGHLDVRVPPPRLLASPSVLHAAKLHQRRSPGNHFPERRKATNGLLKTDRGPWQPWTLPNRAEWSIDVDQQWAIASPSRNRFYGGLARHGPRSLPSRSRPSARYDRWLAPKPGRSHGGFPSIHRRERWPRQA